MRQYRPPFGSARHPGHQQAGDDQSEVPEPTAAAGPATAYCQLVVETGVEALRPPRQAHRRIARAPRRRSGGVCRFSRLTRPMRFQPTGGAQVEVGVTVISP